MSYDPKVVPFDRSAAYMHHRAMKNRRDNNVVDALELLRRAVEHSPDNDEYKLDLAGLLSEMGCLSQSNRLLLDMLSGGKAPSECYYGLAVNLLSASDVPGARRALSRYRGADPRGVYAPDARRLNDELQFYEMFSRPAGRRGRRAAALTDLGCERMREEEFRRAARLFERSLAIEERDEVRALYATALELCGRHRAAVREMRAAAEAEKTPSVRTLCMASQFYRMIQMPRKSRQMAVRAVQQHPAGMEMRMLIHTLSELGMDAEAGECARLAMQETPYDRQLLHVRAVALLRTGAPAAQAAKFWERIVRIDPEDSVAAYYLQAASQGELARESMEYAYQVPKQEVIARLGYVADVLSKAGTDLDAPWREDEKFRRLLKWCLTVDDPRFRRAAVTALATLNDPEAEATLREVFTRPEISCDMKLNAMVLLRLRGADMRRALPPSIDERDGVLPDAEALLPHLPIGLRQACRYASEVLEDDYGLSVMPALALTMLRAHSRRQLVFCARWRIPAYAAALTYCYLSMREECPSFRILCHQFGSDFRRTVFYAARIASALEEESDEQTDRP